MRFAILGSGSRGNAAVVCAGNTRVLVDCGLGAVEIGHRMVRAGLPENGVDAVVITHEHGDHIGGAAKYGRLHDIPLWMSAGTLRAWYDAPRGDRGPRVHTFAPHHPFAIGDLTIHPFPVPHDAREPCQFVLSDGRARLGILSDAGCANQHMRSALGGCDALMLEFNHDPWMLQNGPYRRKLKKRIAGNYGHLSNAQAAELLRSIDRSRLKRLVLTHLSEVNNTPELALQAAVDALGCAGMPDWLEVAHPDQGLDWREIEAPPQQLSLLEPGLLGRAVQTTLPLQAPPAGPPATAPLREVA